MKRPLWVAALEHWFEDGQYARLDKAVHTDAWPWLWRGWLEDAGVAALCRIFGHDPVAGLSGRPDHDYCDHCHLSMPGKASDDDYLP